MIEEALFDAEEKMEKAVAVARDDLSSIRTGRANPGMFARVKLTGETVPNAILVPQRAVQQLLDKTFVMVVGADGKSEARKIELGQQVGSYYIVKSGLSANDTVVVEGLSSLTEGKDLAVTMVTPEEMGFSFDEDTTPFDTMTSSEANSGDSNNVPTKVAP